MIKRAILTLAVLLVWSSAVFAAIARDGTPYQHLFSTNSTSNNAVFPADAHAGSIGFLFCSGSASGAWTTPSGWSIVPNSANTSGPNVIAYEKVLVGGDLGANVPCANATSLKMTVAAFAYSGTIGAIEATDTNAATHNVSGTTCAGATGGLIPVNPTDELVSVCMVNPSGNFTLSAPTNATNTLTLWAAAANSGNGIADALLSTATPTGTDSWTVSSANTSAEITMTLLSTSLPCTNNDACVQQTTVAFGSGADPAPTFSTNTTIGNVLIGWINFSTGTSNASPTGLVGHWSKIADSGSATGGTRSEIWCGEVSYAGTALTAWNVTGGNSRALMAEFTGYRCPSDGTAKTANATTGTSVTTSAYTTTIAHDLVLATGTHSTAESVTDSSGAAFRHLNTSSLIPTTNPSYQVVSSTGSFTPSYSWTTSTHNAAAIVAIPQGSTLQKAYASFDQRVNYRIPPPSPIPTLPNIGLFEWMGISACPASLDSHMVGCAFTVRWADLEPQDGVFEWRPITDREALYSSSNPLQIFVLMGAGGSPTTNALPNSQYRLGCPHCVQALPEPTWLADEGTTTIPINWDYVQGLFSHCTVLNEPWIGDANYQTKFKAFIDAFATKFGSDPKVALIGIPPMSHWGFDVSIAKSTAQAGCPANYNTEWQTATGISDEPTWSSTIQTAFDSLWQYEVDHLGTTLNISLWTEPSQVGAITPANTNDSTLNNALFQYAGQHPPTQIYYCANESLNDNGGFGGFIDAACTPYIGTHVNIGSQDHGVWNQNYNPAAPSPNPYSGWCSAAGGSFGSGTPNYTDAYTTWRDGATFGQEYQNTSTLAGNCQSDSVVCPFNGLTESTVHCISDMLGGP